MYLYWTIKLLNIYFYGNVIGIVIIDNENYKYLRILHMQVNVPGESLEITENATGILDNEMKKIGLQINVD